MLSQFITTEVLNTEGEKTEQLVWRRVQAAFQHRNCVAYWRYPIFLQTGKYRREPDILIADLELGLIIIEVKSLKIEQIVSINGHLWQYQDFYTESGNPYQQAENQLLALLKYTDIEPSLRGKVRARVAIALPLIKQQAWQHLSEPPILFQEDLQQNSTFLSRLAEVTTIVKGEVLSFSQWQLLLSTLGGKPVWNRPHHRVLSDSHSRGKMLAEVRSHQFQYDLNQEKIAKQIPPGPQRIRGIAGSGKTVLLCQKAALMHLKHPNWSIALVFFSRSLYTAITEQVDRWLRHFSANIEVYSPNSNLQILHAWGTKQQPGLYSLLCQETKIQPLSVNDTESQAPQDALAEACVQLLLQSPIPPIFDAILIDEAQDLTSLRWHYQQKQPFYWMAYQALRSVNSLQPEQRRLIWAYDELQSLNNLTGLSARELLGKELAHLVTGSYSGEIKKTEIMSRCYRTPGPIITFAHGLAMGLLRPQGMLMGMTKTAEWEAIGYQVTGNLIPGTKVTLTRVDSSHPLTQLWQKPLIEFHTYTTRQQELTALVRHITHNLRYEGLRPSREILVIILGDFFKASRLETYVANFLIKQGIDVYLPSARDCNCLHLNHSDRFWYEGAVTISRIHRAKGNEADLVYLVGLDQIAQAEHNLNLRNQLFVAITRSKAWLNLSGIGYYPMYQEIRGLLASPEHLTFSFSLPKQQELSITETQELLKRYALGDRNFQNINLSGANLQGIYLTDANLIGADLSYANLSNAQLDRVKLIAADLTQANLTGASLKKAKLMGAKLERTNFTDANLDNAEF
ncbi:pentapeptide repeat-containing protein [Gloeocapsa sp. PCC 73106]|uniref:pentapeptide repeat-containing protein n=1 Tax=Gloeocapsa sp. PCC 73106 TaxID=102232 RepID=UPI0002AC657D|nr:pentapeptide repeat-containing protein [Gloeocapsa sp. PCC 73106]ELR98349.1 DNA/RNA helicase, superfamily I [Gloeocapsa sp. PCC 73106]